MSRDKKKIKVVGFNILEEECIWAKAGIVNYKHCGNAYDCNSCKFDKAMFMARQSGDSGGKPTLREALGKRSSADRQCRHMLTGRVDFKLCDNAYRCEACDFDQMLDCSEEVNPAGEVPLVNVLGYAYADTYYYHSGHTWARVEYGGRIRIGVDDFARRLLGRADGWTLPEIGKRLTQSGKVASVARQENRADFLSPVNGTVIAANRNALKFPALVHADPYGDGWLVLVEPEVLKKELEELHFGPEGKAWLASEAQRLHDLVMDDYGQMAATGAPPVDDVFAEAPKVGWKALVKTFLGSEA